MVFPIMPPQRNNHHPSMYRNSNNRFQSQTNRPVNGNRIQQILTGFSNPDSSIGTIATKGLGDISKTLSNVDQVIKVVQSATPIVQEYGPMVKNLPAMYRMIKAFSQIEDDSDDKTDGVAEISSDKVTNKDDIAEQEIDIFTGKSTPRIYI